MTAPVTQVFYRVAPEIVGKMTLIFGTYNSLTSILRSLPTPGNMHRPSLLDQFLRRRKKSTQIMFFVFFPVLRMNFEVL
jgi:hypothetical protein